MMIVYPCYMALSLGVTGCRQALMSSWNFSQSTVPLGPYEAAMAMLRHGCRCLWPTAQEKTVWMWWSDCNCCLSACCTWCIHDDLPRWISLGRLHEMPGMFRASRDWTCESTSHNWKCEVVQRWTKGSTEFGALKQPHRNHDLHHLHCHHLWSLLFLPRTCNKTQSHRQDGFPQPNKHPRIVSWMAYSMGYFPLVLFMCPCGSGMCLHCICENN